MKIIESTIVVGFIALQAGCTSGSGSASVSDSEVATSVVSGSMNMSGNGAVGYVPRLHRSRLGALVDTFNPISTAFGAEWSCTGGTLSPKFAGPGDYAFSPVSCSVTWGAGRTASSKWSGTFSLDYGASCDDTHAFIGNQVGGCVATRTTATGGNTRTITGPDGNAYAITHDTNGAGTGWDSTVSPAPSNGGASVTCASGGCAAGSSLVIAGSHLSGDVTLAGATTSEKIWDHTVSTDATGLSISGEGTSRVVDGTVTVQHNLAKHTSTITFAGVGYGEAGCCFPTKGSVTAKIVTGADAGRTETLAFSDACGEATLTTASGTESITLQHCL